MCGGNVTTPAGEGKFVEFIPHAGVVIVDIGDNLALFDAKEVYINAESVCNQG